MNAADAKEAANGVGVEQQTGAPLPSPFSAEDDGSRQRRDEWRLQPEAQATGDALAANDHVRLASSTPTLTDNKKPEAMSVDNANTSGAAAKRANEIGAEGRKKNATTSDEPPPKGASVRRATLRNDGSQTVT